MKLYPQFYVNVGKSVSNATKRKSEIDLSYRSKYEIDVEYVLSPSFIVLSSIEIL